jgi:hypothetical protein
LIICSRSTHLINEYVHKPCWQGIAIMPDNIFSFDISSFMTR